MSFERSLAGEPFKIDIFQCREAALKLVSYKLHKESTPWEKETKLSRLIFKILFISICHQFNWDYLQNSLASWLFPKPEKKLEELTNVKANQIAALLSGYSRPERIRAKERADLLRTTALELMELLLSNEFRRLTKKPVLEGPGGFYEVIHKLSAFDNRDKLEKKLRVLAHDLFREGILEFSDPENLRPAVEYHIIRLYLRTGRVFPKDEEIRAVLIGEPTTTRARLVHQLRMQVDEAMRYVALYSGIDIANLNYIEWQIARSQCIPSLDQNTGPVLCRKPATEPLPDDIKILSPKCCPFSGMCFSLNNRDYGWYHEPQFEKAIY